MSDAALYIPTRQKRWWKMLYAYASDFITAKYLLLFGTRPLISITCFSPLCCHHDGVIAGTSLSSRPRYSCAHSQWLAVACRWRPTLNKLFSLKISILFPAKIKPFYGIIKVRGSLSRIRGTGDSPVLGFWVFPCLYYTEFSDFCIFSPTQPNTEKFLLITEIR